MTDKAKRVNVALQLDPDVAAAIDYRLADLLDTHGIKMSRNEWMNKAMRWCLHSLPYGADSRTKISAAQTAPVEVTGSEMVDMGLGDVEQQGSTR